MDTPTQLVIENTRHRHCESTPPNSTAAGIFPLTLYDKLCVDSNHSVTTHSVTLLTQITASPLLAQVLFQQLSPHLFVLFLISHYTSSVSIFVTELRRLQSLSLELEFPLLPQRVFNKSWSQHPTQLFFLHYLYYLHHLRPSWSYFLCFSSLTPTQH